MESWDYVLVWSGLYLDQFLVLSFCFWVYDWIFCWDWSYVVFWLGLVGIWIWTEFGWLVFIFDFDSHSNFYLVLSLVWFILCWVRLGCVRVLVLFGLDWFWIGSSLIYVMFNIWCLDLCVYVFGIWVGNWFCSGLMFVFCFFRFWRGVGFGLVLNWFWIYRLKYGFYFCLIFG